MYRDVVTSSFLPAAGSPSRIHATVTRQLRKSSSIPSHVIRDARTIRNSCRTATASFPPAQPAFTSLPGDDIFNLQLTKATLRANGASEALIDKIGASAFRYFRAMADPFKHRTCEAFRDLARSLAREVIAEWNRFRGQDVQN